MMTRADKRRQAAWKTLVPAEGERAALAAHGVDPASIIPIGYVKAAFRHRSAARTLFADDRPIVVYAPHWQQHRTSWGQWGGTGVEPMLATGRSKRIFSPHQRMGEKKREAR